MAAWRAGLAGAILLWSQIGGIAPCQAQATSVDEVQAIDQANIGSTPPTQRALHPPPAPTGVYPPTALQRMTQRRHEIEALRLQRELEREAANKARKADRAAWMRRWEEQRRRAREQSLARERRYHQELSQRNPALAAHRKRHAEELERRRQALEQERRARWQAVDGHE